MKKSIIVLSLAASVTCMSHAAVFSPITATGWNQDIVIAAGEELTGRTATMDDGIGGARATWYGSGYDASNLAKGIPTGLTTSETLANGIDTVLFQMQEFTQNNAILNSGTLQLSGAYSQLALIGSTGDGTANMQITVNYEGGASQIFDNLGTEGINHDWYTGEDVAYTVGGRVQVGSGTIENNADNPRIYQSVLTLDNTASITSIDILNAGAGNNAIMAISGIAIPEPSALMLGFLGFAAFLRRRR